MNAFDYIIVGAGSAGCVLADRLTANGRHRVLLLEAGGSDQRFWVQVPIGYGKCFFEPRVNWMYRTEPEAALAGRSGYWPRGKLLGGSGAINAMVFVRGQPEDFDAWAAAGNPGWGWRDVLPYFRKLEDSPRGRCAWCVAPAGRSPSPTSAPTRIRCARCSCARAPRPGFRATPTSTARARRVSATTRSPCATGAAFRPRAPI